MSIYPLYKEIFPPTVVEEVAYANFTGPNDINLIVGRTSILQIYKFFEEVDLASELAAIDENPVVSELGHKDEDQDFIFPALKPANSSLTMTAHLELVAQYKLHGNIASIGVIRTISSGANGMDSLLLSFKDAKLSLLEFSLATNNVITVSIHYYEREEFKREFLSNPCTTELRVDPSNRCAVMNFYCDRLAILPFRQEESMHMDEEEIARKLKNVIDMKFLDDYYEPTLAILFEPLQTWPGKLSSKKDSCSLVVVSLDLSQKLYPIIYAIEELPHSSVKLIPIPKPVGGILVVSANSLIHVDQSASIIAHAVNGYAVSATDIPLDQSQERLGLSLEGSQHLVLDSHHVLLFLANGKLYLVEFIIDGRYVSRMDVRETGESTLASCVCRINDEYVFVGSRLGDSHLIKYKLNQNENEVNKNTIDEPDLYGSGSKVAANNTLNETIDGNETSSNEIDFKICDTLTNVGPIIDMAYGEPAYPEGVDHTLHKDLELVTCSGYGKSGSLYVFHRNVDPRLISSFALEDCQNMWTVRCRKEYMYEGIKIDNGRDLNDDETFDNYLFISLNNRTMLLATGEELQELENSGFYADGPTIAVGSLLNELRIVQVHSGGLYLLDGDCKEKQLLPMAEDSEKGSIVFASIVDPYVLLLFQNGDITLLKADEKTNDIDFYQPSTINDKGIPIESCCLYRDDTALFALVEDVSVSMPQKAKIKKNDVEQREIIEKDLIYPTSSLDIDDQIDNELYGDANDPADNIISEEDENMKLDNDLEHQEGFHFLNDEIQGNDKEQITYWCTIHRKDGSLEIYRLPEFEEVFYCPHFDLFPAVLSDMIIPQKNKSPGLSTEINEITMANLGGKKKAPYLIARSNIGDIVIYKAFRYLPGNETSSEPSQAINSEDYRSRLAVRFSRAHNEYISRETIHSDDYDKPSFKKNVTQNGASHESNDLKNNDPEKKIFAISEARQSQLIPFTNISGYSGVFVTGDRPAWLICSGKSYLRIHPMSGDGVIKCFTQFHNINCHHGFLYSNKEEICRMSELPRDFSYDMEWAVRKVPLGRSVHGVEYHPEMQVYIVMTSEPIPFHIRDENGDPIDGEHDDAHYRPDTYRYFLELVSPITWETVDEHKFYEDEQGLSVKCVSLQTKSTASGRKFFVAVGTGYFRGEDVGTRGTVYIFEIVEVVPEPDNPQSNHKYKMLCFEDTKGSVTAMCDVNGYLLTCVGPKIFIRAFEDNDRLISVAFIDIQIYVTTVASIKDFILLGDVYKSLWFLGFQEEPAKLALLGKDYHELEVVSANFILDGKVLSFVVSDINKNLHLFQYAPHNVQSFAGHKLIRRGDFHVGGQVKATLMMPQREVTRRYLDRDHMINEDEGESVKRLCLCGTLDGSIGMITPIPEKMYKRMQLLYSQMVNGIQHPAGLNPKSFRLLQSNQRLATNPAKGVLDGDLLFQFPNLSLNRQREMTKQIGTTPERIMDDLLAVQISCDYF
ncbi:hypothetical protein G9A89_018283 [Geosiphon pyriformis]|nr:hypothetical protein G9A89_018283 [Geosiphon pyriformis]